MKFRPLNDRVVIRRAESDWKSKGGIVIPDTAKEKPQEGEGIAVGPSQAQEFLSAHAFIHSHFHPRRHRMTANDYRAKRKKAFKIWTQETCVEKAA